MKKVLVIGYVYPEPNSSAAGVHILSIMRLFKEQGWKVTFATSAQKSDHSIELKKEGFTTKEIELNSSSFDEYLQRLQPDIVLFDRFMIEEQFGWRVEKNAPNALKILDTEDLQCLRKARHQAHREKRAFLFLDLLSSEVAKREIASILRCDISLIISSYEMKLLTEEFKIERSLLYYLPFMVDPKRVPKRTKTFQERQHFVTIGNFRHAPNWDMVLYLQEIWQKIHKELPHAQLHIYGAYPPPKAMALHNPKKGFYIKGWAKDVNEVMQNARVCLAPLRFGAGIKGKLLDAMINQTPSVTTTIGSEGMHNKNEPWSGIITNDIDSFVEASISLYEDESLWREAVKHGHQLLYGHYNKEELADAFIKNIVMIQKDLKQHRLNNFIGAMLKHHTMQSTKYMSQWIEEKNKNSSSTKT